ncbi:TRAP transporter substrate-binding protein [Mailhella massiliensis]|uniref:TRAP transporter substrate-binding protein n=1 Tax=Mailhella massiliensis TaxID=1903261 RepID=A0A921AVL4_9BACT|nr:TRAP transporter substrate-binding protein [Mailhella massiliensis]HJD96881.1 TRAP transporter substrate-binding protein [Mailhella massiliensis]
MLRFPRLTLLLALTVCFASAPLSSAQAAKPLKFAEQNSETSWGSVHGTQPWIKKVEEASGGAITFDLYANQSLAKGSQVWSATKKGIADVSWNAMATYPGMNPLAEVITLPGLPYSTPMEASEALWKMYEKFPQFARPYADNKLLALFTSDVFNLVSTKPIRTLEDLKGKKIRTVAGPLVDALEALGAIPVVIPMPDVYLALQRGTIDGTLASWEPINGFRFYEVAKYVVTNAPFGFSFFGVAMNKKAYNRLPEAGKAAIDANSGLAGSVWWAENFSYSSRSVLSTLRENGVQLETFELSPEERARWVEKAGEPIWEAWAKHAEEEGLTEARAVLDFALGKNQ